MSFLGHQLATSVLVVGAGRAGLRAAIEIAETGMSVIAVGSRANDRARTAMEPAGIEEMLATTEFAGGWQERVADLLQDNHLPADTSSVHSTARKALQAVYDLERYVMRFDCQCHSRNNSRYVAESTYVRNDAFDGDCTGREVQRILRERADRLAIPILSDVYITRLLVDDGTVFGAYGIDLIDGSRYIIRADAVIIATGGHTRIWQRTSSRRGENTGDSFRLAVEAGARLRSAELVQFHPFGLIKPENAAGALVSDTVRSEGGILLNNLGERFMARYDSERMEFSNRDNVSLASYSEIKEGRGTQDGGVWLDLSHLPRETVITRLPRVHQMLLDLQMLDVTRDPIEVAPTAHYSTGGVWVRPEDHSTDVNGLFAIGEAASGLHGANRWEQDSLVELLRHSKIAGRAAAEYSAKLTGQQRSLAAIRAAETDVNRLLAADGDQNVRALQRSVRRLMTEHAGILRSEAGLIAGITALDEIETRMVDVGVHIDISGFQDLAYAFNLRSTVLAARATLESALERRETRGCHIRSDYPDPNPALAVNLVWSPDTGVRREPVQADVIKLTRGVSPDSGLTE
ncbi:FAD-binding protein [Streptomyces sp. NPDC058985]|uniref:FAD-binding protein n=1 Tax=Streptomyces sp. NPDC058985 TaxID=3346684 RepID=UPI0036CE3F5A